MDNPLRQRERDRLRTAIEDIQWTVDASGQDSVEATLRLPPFCGWRIGIERSTDKWDMGTYTYWVAPCGPDPVANAHLGGSGYMLKDDAEIHILKRLVQLKRTIQDERASS